MNGLAAMFDRLIQAFEHLQQKYDDLFDMGAAQRNVQSN